jgi:hypothetical protein
MSSLKNNKVKLLPIFDKYSKTLTELIKNVSDDVTNEEEKTHLDQIKRLIRLCPQEERLLKTKNTLWDLRNFILARDHVGLKNIDPNKFIDVNNTEEEKEFIFSIIDIIKSRYDDIKDDKKNIYWQLLTILLQCIIEYRQITCDY